MKKILSMVFCLMPVFSISPEILQVHSERLNGAKYFNLHINYDEDIKGNISLNDFPVGEFSGKGGSISSNLAQSYSRKDMNQLKLGIDGTPGKEIRVRYYALKEPGFPEDEFIIFDKTITLKGKEELLFEFDLGKVPPARIFDLAEKIETVTSQDKADIYRQLQTIQKCFMTGNMDGLLSVMDVMIEESAVVSDQDPGVSKTRFKEMFKKMKVKSVTLAPENTLSYKLYNQQFLEVTVNGKAPLKIKFKDMEADGRYFFAKINGQWKPVLQ